MKNNNWKIWIPIYGMYAVLNEEVDLTKMDAITFLGSAGYQALCGLIVIAVVLTLLLVQMT